MNVVVEAEEGDYCGLNKSWGDGVSFIDSSPLSHSNYSGTATTAPDTKTQLALTQRSVALVR